MAKKKQTPRVVSEETDREEALANTLAAIGKAHGEGAIMRLGQQDLEPVPVIPTGSIGLDQALGVGGLPKGRVVEVFGPEASGKTTLALQAVANAQAAGGVAVFIDAEHAFDPAYARALGVNLEELLMSQPDCGEQALSIAESLVRSNAVDVVVIDSVAALAPRAELDGEMGDVHVGLQARLMSQALRKLTGALARSKTCMIFINQIRMKIGVQFGSPETTSGGRALKFYSSVRIDVRRTTSVKEADQVIGALVRARVVKNKVAAPFRDATFEIIFGQGISREGELIDLGEAQGVLTKSGAWYSFGETRLGNGREKVRRFLKDTPDLASEIETAIRTEADGQDAQEAPIAQAS